jgi:DNA (cytosine-5)-methyltransferase 1
MTHTKHSTVNRRPGPESRKAAIFSFFSGGGFLDLGFEDAGFEIVLVNEIYEPFMRGYQYSRKVLGHPEPRFGFDLASIDTFQSSEKRRELEGQIRTLRDEGYLIGFIGGPPCPDFSVGGKNRGREGDNGRLSESYTDLICSAKPDFFLFENVKGLWRTHKHRDFYETLKKKFKRAGYETFDRLTNAIEYGAPQDRDRIILLGFLKPTTDFSVSETDWTRHTTYPGRSAFDLPWPATDGSDSNSRKHRVLPSELTVKHWFEQNQVNRHPNRRHVFTARAGLSRFQSTLEGDVSRKSYKRLHRYRYSPTAAYGNNEVHIHPTLPRRITVAEALAIQSLPGRYELPSDMTLSAMFKLVGNGVPYLAARGIAEMISGLLSRAFPISKTIRES